MKKLVSLLAMVLAVSLAQEGKLFWDGQDWIRLGRLTEGHPEFAYMVKAAYVNGVLDGRLYDYLRIWPADSSLADSLYSETVDYLRTSEIIRGLDNFYADPFHRYIPIESAIIIVNMYAERQPLEVIDAYILKSKEWINHLSLEMQKEDMYRLMQEKQKKHAEKAKD